MIDEVRHVVFLRACFKGDTADLSHADYRLLEAESEKIFSAPIDYEWRDA